MNAVFHRARQWTNTDARLGLFANRGWSGFVLGSGFLGCGWATGAWTQNSADKCRRQVSTKTVVEPDIQAPSSIHQQSDSF